MPASKHECNITCDRESGGVCSLIIFYKGQKQYLSDPAIKESLSEKAKFTPEQWVQFLRNLRKSETMCGHPEDVETAILEGCQIAKDSFGITLDPATLQEMPLKV